MASKLSGLGKGLDMIFMENNIENENIPVTLKIDEIEANKLQPRTSFKTEALEELSNSIASHGIIQPIVVKPLSSGKYKIIAGERRYRAAKMAGIIEVPVIIKDIDDKKITELALVENLQRENLSAIEEAEGLSRLMNEYEYTQEVIAKVIGKSRSHIANTLRLLSLPDEIKQMIKENKLSAGHARTLVGKDNALELAEKIIKEGLSVREAEALAANSKELDVRKIAPKTPKTIDEDIKKIMADLEARLKLKVKINAGKKGKGSITLHYNTPSELSSLLDILEQR